MSRAVDFEEHLKQATKKLYPLISRKDLQLSSNIQKAYTNKRYHEVVTLVENQKYSSTAADLVISTGPLYVTIQSLFFLVDRRISYDYAKFPKVITHIRTLREEDKFEEDFKGFPKLDEWKDFVKFKDKILEWEILIKKIESKKAQDGEFDPDLNFVFSLHTNKGYNKGYNNVVCIKSYLSNQLQSLMSLLFKKFDSLYAKRDYKKLKPNPLRMTIHFDQLLKFFLDISPLFDKKKLSKIYEDHSDMLLEYAREFRPDFENPDIPKIPQLAGRIYLVVALFYLWSKSQPTTHLAIEDLSNEGLLAELENFDFIEYDDGIRCDIFRWIGKACRLIGSDSFIEKAKKFDELLGHIYLVDALSNLKKDIDRSKIEVKTNEAILEELDGLNIEKKDHMVRREVYRWIIDGCKLLNRDFFTGKVAKYEKLLGHIYLVDALYCFQYDTDPSLLESYNNERILEELEGSMIDQYDEPTQKYVYKMLADGCKLIGGDFFVKKASKFEELLSHGKKDKMDTSDDSSSTSNPEIHKKSIKSKSIKSKSKKKQSLNAEQKHSENGQTDRPQETYEQWVATSLTPSEQRILQKINIKIFGESDPDIQKISQQEDIKADSSEEKECLDRARLSDRAKKRKRSDGEASAVHSARPTPDDEKEIDLAGKLDDHSPKRHHLDSDGHQSAPKKDQQKSKDQYQNGSSRMFRETPKQDPTDYSTIDLTKTL